MAHRIYLNVQDVHSFQEKMQAEFKDPTITSWIEKKLRNYLMSEYKNVIILSDEDVRAYYDNKEMPTIIQKALENKENIYNIAITNNFKQQLQDLKDFFVDAMNKNTDITGMQFDVALEASEKWHKSFGKKNKKRVDAKLLSGLKVIENFDNGCFLAKLITKKQFDYEGSMMSHCVSGYYGRETSIMSYRTSENKPIITIEYDKSPNGKDITIKQARGFANHDYIDDEHIVNILNYLYTNYRKVTLLDAYPFGAFEKDAPIISLAEGFVFKRPMHIEDCVGLPKNAVFEGDVIFERARMPLLKNVTINGDVTFVNSKTFAIDPSVTVTGKIKSQESLLIGVPSHYQYKFTRTN
jgi:hypothetical protein